MSTTNEDEQQLVKSDVRDWAGLPDYLQEKIYLHLFNGDSVRFRLTCKEWQSVTINPPTMSSPPHDQVIQHSSTKLFPLLQSSSEWLEYSTKLSYTQFPWLMFFSNRKSRPGVFEFFHPISYKTYVIEIPELAGAQFRYSKNGWLLMSKGERSFFFFNPFTMSMVELPDVKEGTKLVSVYFTAPPTSPDCKVFGHGSVDHRSVELNTWFHGEDQWYMDILKDDEDIEDPFTATICTPVLCNGDIFSLGEKGSLAVYDVTDEPPSWNVSEETIVTTDCVLHCTSYLAECDGELVSVFVGHTGKPVLVFRLDWSTMKWHKLESLGSKTMFVNETGSIILEAKSKGTENMIFFPRFRIKKGGEFRRVGSQQDDRHRKGVFYSLQTGKYHCTRSNFSSDDWHATIGVHDHCTWIQPNVEQLNCLVNSYRNLNMD